MYARVSRYRVPADKLGIDVSGAQETERRVEAIPGSLGLYYLVDRESGQTMAITLWEDEEAMRRSESAASDLRHETTSAASAETIGIERYEVVTQPSKVPAGSRA